MPSPRDLVLYLLLVVMELSAGFAVLVGSSLLDGVTAHYGLFWLMLLAGAAGLAATLVVMRAGPGEPWNRLILLGGALVGAVLPAIVASRNLVSFLIASFILLGSYWRGMAATEEPPTHRDILSRFGFGLGLLFLGLVWIVARGIDRDSSVWHMMAVIGIGYTIITLIALGIARVEHAREPGAGAAILLAVGAQLALIIFVGLLALQVFSMDIAGALYAPTKPFWDALGARLFDFLTLIAGPIDWFINFLRPHHANGTTPRTIPPNFGAPPDKKPKPPTRVNNHVVAIVAFSVGFIILLGVAYLIWRTLPRIGRRQGEGGYTEKRETLTLHEMWQLVLAWLRRLVGRGMEATTEAVAAGRRRLIGDLPEDPVRRAYAQMLRRAAAVGMPRPAGVTPQEFRDRLTARWPDGGAHFAGLTAAYARRRYGELAPTPLEIEAVRVHWGRVRPLMRVQARERVEADAPQAVAPGGRLDRLIHPGRWRISIPSLREILRPPEPTGDTEIPDWRSKVLTPIVSLVFPIVFFVVVLAVLAVISAHGGH